MKITLSLSAKMNGTKSEILMRISVSRGACYRVKSRLFISPFRFRDGKIVVPRYTTPEQGELVTLQGKLSQLESYLTEVLLEHPCQSSAEVQALVDAFHNPKKSASPFWAEWDNWVSLCKVSDARKIRYNVMRNNLIRYERWRRSPLTLELTSQELQHLEEFLRDEHTWNPEVKPRGDNLLNSMMTILRTFYNSLLKQGKVLHNPFSEYVMPKELYGTPYYLTLDERDAIAEFDYGDSLNKQRDIFIFQCLVGCRVSDLLRLTANNIVDGILEYTPSKTMESAGGRVVRVPLNDRAQTIVDKYGAIGDEKLLPFISSQKYNVAIKALLLWANIDRKVTIINPITREEERKPLYEVCSSHLARRTFIGNLYKQVQDPNLIGSMSGHAEGSRAFSRYRHIDEDIKRSLVDLIK